MLPWMSWHHWGNADWEKERQQLTPLSWDWAGVGGAQDPAVGEGTHHTQMVHPSDRTLTSCRSARLDRSWDGAVSGAQWALVTEWLDRWTTAW